MVSLKPTSHDRFWAKVQKTDACWNWTAYLNHYGYGMFYVAGRSVHAHRYSWFLDHGEMPASLVAVCHRCDNPRCVNPDHLFLGSRADNVRDMLVKGRYNHKAWSQTHCKNGHPLTPDNLRPRKDGARLCLTCSRAYAKRWKANKKAQFTSRQESVIGS